LTAAPIGHASDDSTVALISKRYWRMGLQIAVAANKLEISRETYKERINIFVTEGVS
jgi:hypothetical protein